MSISNPTLSICIPTYNRSHLLKESIAYILSAVKGYEDKIEIVISDNASTDDTKEVVQQFLTECPFMRYHRNDENIREMNFYMAASLARGDYFWLFSDDDRMNPEAIGLLLTKIELNYNLIIINYSIWTNDYLKVLKEKQFSFKGDMDFYDHNALLGSLGLRLGFICCVVIKKDIFFLLPEKDYKPFLEHGFPFVYSVYYAVVKKCRAHLIAKPSLAQRGSTASAYADKSLWYKCFVTGSSLIFQELGKKGYSKNAIRHAKYLVLKDDVLHDISFRKRRGENLEGIFQLLRTFYNRSLFFWMVIAPMLIAPHSFIWLANKIVNIIRRVRKQKF
jgi:abequosyltransferase